MGQPRSAVFGLILLSASLSLSSALAQETAQQVKRAGWCEIRVPKNAAVGETIQVRIKLTGLDGDVYLSCDLKDQNHGMMKWGGEPRKIKPGHEAVYEMPIRDADGLQSVYALVYVTRKADDDYTKAVETTSSDHVIISGRTSQADVQYNKSWIYVDASAGGKELVSGDRWKVPVEYYLDPSEHFGTTTLSIWGTGPWIDSPDGKYTKKRGHIGYPGLGGRVDLKEPGRGRHVFTFTVPKGLELVKKYNRLLLIANFRDAQGKSWPWSVRAENHFVRKRGFFEIESEKPGNLFTYEEKVRLAIRLKNVKAAGEKKTLTFVVHDTSGAKVDEGQVEFAASQDGQVVAIEPSVAGRGVFLIEVDVPDWEKRHTTFARIPDLQAVTQGRATRFGMTNHMTAPPEEAWAIARRLGLTTCRRFTNWYRHHPGPGVFKLDELEAELEAAGRHGVDVWLCIYDPPAFAQPGKVTPISYRAFDFREDVWREFVATATKRLKGKFMGWEWLNEITPGGCDDPVGTYLAMCRIGTETAKEIDPNLMTILAGGLYPRSFRLDMLKAGVGQYIDALPVHYQNGSGIIEARADLDAAGLSDVAVWEDESGRPRNAWGVPPLEEIQGTNQADWVLRQWTDELAAGCEKIIFFGGRGSATGSWDYLLDDLSPRPVAATLAVFTSKMFEAQPLGTFMLGDGGVFHLFERDGQAVLVASTYESDGETIPIFTGSESVLLTDYQGNERRIVCRDGVAELQLAGLPVFIEGGSLESMTACIIPEIQVAQVAAGTSASVATARRVTPRSTALPGQTLELPVRFRNLFDTPLTGRVEIQLPDGWSQQEPQAFTLPAKSDLTGRIALLIPAETTPADYPASLVFRFDSEALPAVEKPVVLSVISPNTLGNLIANGDFETPDAKGTGPEGWRVDGKTRRWTDATGLGDGLGKRVLEFQDSPDWSYISRSIPVRGGQTYLYTFWVRNEDMGCGSNMTQRLSDGREIRLYDTQVMRCGESNPHWRVFTCRKQMPEGAVQASFTPIAKGSGWATIDNVRVTLYDGTDYVAEAHHVAKAPKIDGQLDDWIMRCPIPLIGRNQLVYQVDGYQWTPDNLSGIAYLMWDARNLYLAARVRDDTHHSLTAATPSGEQAVRGDSLVLGIQPVRSDSPSKAFAYYLTSAAPGGGSGAHTLFRPADKTGGRESGHLFRDSSIYELAVRPGKGVCTYELRIPLSELGLSPGLGTKFGLSALLNDNDGGRKPVARMTWGGGLEPAWVPEQFGMVTFVN